MAAIGKIRSWGPVLATLIGLALFAFIAEEFFRSCESTTNEKRQQVRKSPYRISSHWLTSISRSSR